jgi:hypothetical protein
LNKSLQAGESSPHGLVAQGNFHGSARANANTFVHTFTHAFAHIPTPEKAPSFFAVIYQTDHFQARWDDWLKG